LVVKTPNDGSKPHWIFLEHNLRTRRRNIDCDAVIILTFISGCGSVPSIENGIVSLDETSIIGSVANVTCNKGYYPSSPTITCQMTGSWETVSCVAKGNSVK
jgi:hypothetical protein